MAMTLQSAVFSKNVFTHGEQLTLQLQLLPTSNVSLLSASLFVDDVHTSADGEEGAVRFRLCTALVAADTIVADGAVHTVSDSFTVEANTMDPIQQAVLQQRALKLSLRISYADGNGTAQEIWQKTDAVLLNRYLNPRIDLFSLERHSGGTAADDGLGALVSMRLALEGSYQGFSLSASWEGGSANLDGFIYDGLKGVSESAEMIEAEFSAERSWTLQLNFGDAYESVQASAVLPAGFANLHLSGKARGGASFGGFSTATDDAPKLESHYPAYFYAGIEGISNFSREEVLTGGHWVDGRPIYRRVLVFGEIVHGGSLTIPLETGPLSAVVKFYGYGRQYEQFRPIPFASPDIYACVAAGLVDIYTNPSMMIICGSGGGMHEGWVVVEYTKAADAAA